MFKSRKKQRQEMISPFARMRDDVLNHICGFVENPQNIGRASTELWTTLISRNRHKNKVYIVGDTNVKGLLRAISEPLVSLETTGFDILEFTPLVQSYMPELYELVRILYLQTPTNALVFPVTAALIGLKEAWFLHTLSLDCNVYAGRDAVPGAHGMGNEGALALVALKDAPSLHTLYLGLRLNGIDGDGLQFLIALKDNRKLRSLCVDLSGNQVNFSKSTGSRSLKGATALAALKDIPNLQVLDLNLRETSLDIADIEVVVTLRHAPQLQKLRLVFMHNSIGDEGLMHIAKFNEAKKLQCLDLDLTYSTDPEWDPADRFARISPMGMQHLVALKRAPVLEILHLSLTIVDDEDGWAGAGGVREPSESPAAPFLHTLHLSFQHCSPIGDTGARHVASFINAIAIKNLYLDLGSNNIGAAGATALGTLNGMHTLSLELRNNPITAAGVHGLAKLRNSSDLHTLHIDLNGCLIDDDETWALVQGLKAIPAIKKLSLNLGRCHISRFGAAAFGELRLVDSLRELVLSLDDNSIGDAGVADLIEIRHALNLRRIELGLSGNRIGHAGAAAIATLNTNPVLCELHIDMTANNIGDTGALFLGALRYTSNLKKLRLNLYRNAISAQGLENLRTILSSQGPNNLDATASL
jgi:hypothetical protein